MTQRIQLTILTAAALTLSGGPMLYACSGCGCTPAPKTHDHIHDHAHSHDIGLEEMKTTVRQGNAVILDARAGKYDDGQRIPGAQSLNSQSSAEDIASVIPNKEAAVVTYCSSTTCPASKALATHLGKLGYTNVKEYPAGIAGWKEAGQSVEQAK
jgi:rhodanese-related sulfurtransferase